MSDGIPTARLEVYSTLSLCNFCTSKIAISFIQESPATFTGNLIRKCWFFFSIIALLGLVAGELAFVTGLLVSSSSVAAFVASLHIIGYGCMSLAKALMLWFKRQVFTKVVNDLIELWPVSIKDENAAVLKRQSLTALRFGQLCYMFWNIVGVAFYNITPIVLYLYHLSRGVPADLGYVWSASYPIDKTRPLIHELVYVFESFAGVVSVWAQLSSDLMFTTMASHISMLLRLLQVRIRNLGSLAPKQDTDSSVDHRRSNSEEPEHNQTMDYYKEIVLVIKVHQRLISYSTELEDVFGMVNLINVLLSSVNICCVVFNIALLEPWMDVSNKLFLGAGLTQMGILCWYADEIVQASVGVADAVYESGWYYTDPRCRRALLLLLKRSQKPLYFTALKFRNITMTTFTSIITTSYSYFTLLYTMYNSSN